MKKILTASLVAMMAVSAARAEIASVKYVDDADKVITDTIGQVTEGKTVVQMISEAVSGGSSGALAEAKAYTDELANGAVKTNTQAIAALDTTYVSESEMTTFKGLNDTAIADAKKAGTDAATALAEYETANNKALADEIDRAKAAEKVNADAIAAINNAETGIGAATLAEAKAYTDELANGAVKTNTQAIAALDTTYVSESEMTTFKGLNDTAIADAKKAGTDAATALAEYEEANDLALAGVKATADAAQPKTDKALNLGAANGAWVDLTSTEANYQTNGTYSLTLVNGTPKWTLVK